MGWVLFGLFSFIGLFRLEILSVVMWLLRVKVK